MSGNKTDNGVLEVGTDEIRVSYSEDTPGQYVDAFIKEQEKAFHEAKNKVKKNFSQVFQNPLKGFPYNEEITVTENPLQEGKYLKYSDLLLKKSRELAQIDKQTKRNPNYSLKALEAINKEIEKEQKKLGITEENLQEGTWAVPDSYKKLYNLQVGFLANKKAATELNSRKLLVDLYGIFGDDSLYDDVGEYIDTPNPKFDLRDLLVKHLKPFGIKINNSYKITHAPEEWIDNLGKSESKIEERLIEGMPRRGKGNIKKPRGKMVSFVMRKENKEKEAVTEQKLNEETYDGKNPSFEEFQEASRNMSGSKLSGAEISSYFRKHKVRDKTVRKAVEIALDHGGAMNYAIKQIEKLKRGLSKHKDVEQALMVANFGEHVSNEDFDKFFGFFTEDKRDLTEASAFETMQDIVKNKQAQKIKGVMVDMFTASVVVRAYDKVNDSNKKKIENSNLETLVKLAHKVMGIKEGTASRQIAKMTGTREKAVQQFIDSNDLQGEKLLQKIKKNRKLAKDFAMALSGKPGNKLVKQFTEALELEEAPVLPSTMTGGVEADHSIEDGVKKYEEAINKQINSGEFSKMHKERGTKIVARKAQKFYRVETHEMGRAGSIHAFIEIETGDIFKPAGWKQAAKGARGNVTDQRYIDFVARYPRAYHGGHLYK